MKVSYRQEHEIAINLMKRAIDFHIGYIEDGIYTLRKNTFKGYEKNKTWEHLVVDGYAECTAECRADFLNPATVFNYRVTENGLRYLSSILS